MIWVYLHVYVHDCIRRLSIYTDFYSPQVHSYGQFLHVAVTTINSNKTTTHQLNSNTTLTMILYDVMEWLLHQEAPFYDCFPQGLVYIMYLHIIICLYDSYITYNVHIQVELRKMHHSGCSVINGRDGQYITHCRHAGFKNAAACSLCRNLN